MLFNFTKMHGLGNDMILIDDREEKSATSTNLPAESCTATRAWAQTIC